MDVYELRLSHSTPDYRYYVDHRFAAFPTRVTVKALQAEACDWFNYPYDEAPTMADVQLVRLDADDTTSTQALAASDVPPIP
jgi:hypothetical protein